ncbi:MAG TPA: NAD(P)H-hydrate dehydratase [Gemmatimonadaceae bacterium]|nr:NAD(P)H-hydrate dehydratase [Gemmatimonadaceae bacterium]
MRKSPRSSAPRAARVTRALLRKHPLPQPSSDDDKEERGRILIVGGERELPGALILAGVAALRAGAGKLQIATCRSVAPLIGIAVPECLAVGLEETRHGTIAPRASAAIRTQAATADAVLIGPGMRAANGHDKLVADIIDNIDCPIILDAGIIESLSSNPESSHRLDGQIVLTPHAGEMSALTGVPKEEIEAVPAESALDASRQFQAVVALKGSETFIATPDGQLYRYTEGDTGLATSGSGDVLAGIIAGFLARGAAPLNATLWGVFVHGAAGNVLSKRVGRVGFLAREIPDEIPRLLHRN